MKSLIAVFSALCVISLAACGGGGGDGASAASSQPALQSISITPMNPSVGVGASTLLAATANYSDGSQTDVTGSAAWSSSNTAVATDDGGNAVGVAAGMSTLSASFQGLSATTTLTVTAATLVSIGITPPNPTSGIGATEPLTATGTYTDNSTLNLTSQVTWASDTPSVATISNGSGLQGLATAVAAGSANITATLNDVVSPSDTLTVLPPQVAVYPAPAGITPSSQYTASISQGGASSSSFVYQVQNPGFLANGQSSGADTSSTLERATSWTSFSFSAPVTVQVINNKSFASARILPTHAQITPTVNGKTVSFTLTQPGQYVVAFCPMGTTCSESNDTDLSNPMLVFANPPEAGVPNPASANVLSVTPGLSVPGGGSVPQLGANQNTLYFGPGVYDLGPTPLTVASNETVYLAGGAYVKGFISLAKAAGSSTIQGRGILSGESVLKAQCIVTAAGCPFMVDGEGNVQNLVVSGITFIQSPFYNIQIGGGSGNTVENVKIIAWAGNSDGVQVSVGSQDAGSLVQNSFIKNGDDTIKLASSNLVVRNCVLWKLNNAAVFQLGTATPNDVSNITVENSDVIRSEYDYPNSGNAIFSANQGGAGNLSNFTFQDIRVENSSWQLFKIQVNPGAFQATNTTQLGSISGVAFNNIQVTDTQEFLPIFRGFNRAHPVANVTFNNVMIAGITAPNPPNTYNVNRDMSYTGTTVGNPLLREQQTPTNFQIPIFPLPTASAAPFYSVFPISQPNLTASWVAQGSGDFFGDGYASAVFTNTSTGQVGIWVEPYLNSTTPWSTQFGLAYSLLPTDGAVAGVGDFNGDGYSDLVLWNSSTQQGKILLMTNSQVIAQISFAPGTASTWSVAGVGDFNGDGVSDVLLRDTKGNLEVVYFNSAAGAPTTTDFPVSALSYSPTTNYATTYGNASGNFDSTWSVAATGLFQSLGLPYASILWVNSSTGQVGVTAFTPFATPSTNGTVFAKLPANTQLQAVGDFNGDNAKDLLLQDPSALVNTIWFLDYDNGALYQAGPTFPSTLIPGWQAVAN